MKDKDWFLILGVALAMSPITYFAGKRAWGWESQYGLPYLTVNIMIPVILGAVIYFIRTKDNLPR